MFSRPSKSREPEATRAARPKRRGIARVVVVMMMTLIPIVGSAATASAHDGDHWWPTDGCTMAPELYFNHACVHHDGCYAYHWADRGTCDAWFRNDMLATCRTLPFDLIGSCTATAFVYYGAVRAFGGFFYDSPEVATRIGTPMA
jgi:hypothetical protein